MLACRLGVQMVNLDLTVHAEGTSFGQMRRKGLKVVRVVADGDINHTIDEATNRHLGRSCKVTCSSMRR